MLSEVQQVFLLQQHIKNHECDELGGDEGGADSPT